ncbi:MAG: 5-amino-6-(D-ribitylamino)uracil--L-tyrosine 4-hydroxyphenyl transferase CofH [Minwuia sp.]|uniref:5-amino-6-(D-ribitylamino)uracil--L-tyrosine 4-hydroxyphenyl transferase CofH n=1 Tax=Minwuia sp. TaxID=2493630 RepID=UPI003A869B71
MSDAIRSALAGERLSRAAAMSLVDAPLAGMLEGAAELRDRGHGDTVTYSRKVFIPLTHLCRDVCHYCTFAEPPKKGEAAFLSPEQVLEIARAGAEAGCNEALFTLGDKPELRYRAAREALEKLGYETTLDYLAAMADLAFTETGLLPHLNPGLMDLDDLKRLRAVSVSMGIMLESDSEQLLARGGPHFGSPDKEPQLRIDCMDAAGEAAVPFTSGILIGIGETRADRLSSLLRLRDLDDRHGHIQEIIVQNFRAKPDTKMKDAPEPSLDDLLWTIAAARLIFGPEMHIQAPPNLSPGVLPQLVGAGIDDWGGVSPVTPDFVNPEAPWPHLEKLAGETRKAGKQLVQRLPLYQEYALKPDRWLDRRFVKPVLDRIDGQGLVRDNVWSPGDHDMVPGLPEIAASDRLSPILERAAAGHALTEAEIVRLFQARGDDFRAVAEAADALRREVNGDTVSYVVTRNINYTNVCYFKCQFCAFSKGKLSENLRGRPYDIGLDEIGRRVEEAWARGATEVCMQGGIHPDYTGATYLDIARRVKAAAPDMHVHAFSPLEVHQGAATSGMPVSEFVRQLREAGLGTLPGTAAEVLDDEVREVLCPDKLRTEQWIEVMQAAHGAGFRTTATVMFGHVDRYPNWARHLLRLRELQSETGGFTEFVPLPFVHMEAPIYLKGRARRGPTFREAVLMHSIPRLVFHGLISNIQTSWVKMGPEGVKSCLNAGANDLGGTLMNETITRAAGASYGEEMPPEAMEALILAASRTPRQRTTTYDDAPAEQVRKSFGAAPLADVVNTPAARYDRDRRPQRLVRPGLEA